MNTGSRHRNSSVGHGVSMLTARYILSHCNAVVLTLFYGRFAIPMENGKIGVYQNPDLREHRFAGRVFP